MYLMLRNLNSAHADGAGIFSSELSFLFFSVNQCVWGYGFILNWKNKIYPSIGHESKYRYRLGYCVTPLLGDI